MKSNPTREALNHFAASALIGLAITGLSAVLPGLVAQQQQLAPQTAGYAVLSLLIGAGTGLYAYVKAHQAQLVDTVTGLLGDAPTPLAAQDQQS
jgi:ABC-type Mn2+/Zn2+ transport system permease subunit